MYLIMLEPYEDGSRTSLQTWDMAYCPEGYAFCPDEFFDVFYSTTPAGFVNITVADDENGNPVVTAMEVNRDAYNAYVAAHPEPDEAEDASIDYDAVLLDHDYRLLCLEAGLTQ